MPTFEKQGQKNWQGRAKDSTLIPHQRVYQPYAGVNLLYWQRFTWGEMGTSFPCNNKDRGRFKRDRIIAKARQMEEGGLDVGHGYNNTSPLLVSCCYD